jgi:phospholipid/cholesterol/gamma-HCH transport system permease protein
MLLVESLYWLFVGPFRGQPIRLLTIVNQIMIIGLNAVPIVLVLSFSVGVMLAIQGIHTLRTFGAQEQVVLGIALSIVREFGPLITAVVVAGRSGSALAARIGTMQVSQEIDALRVMSIDPVRHLAAPVLVAMVIVLPCLTYLSDMAGLLGGALYTRYELGMSVEFFMLRSADFLGWEDISQGFSKSLVFACIIALVGVSNGFQVTGGAEGVGRATTRAVVLSIACIVIADMLFTYYLTL